MFVGFFARLKQDISPDKAAGLHRCYAGHNTNSPLKIHLDDARGALEQPPTLSVLGALGVGAAVVLFALTLAGGSLDLRARVVCLR